MRPLKQSYTHILTYGYAKFKGQLVWRELLNNKKRRTEIQPCLGKMLLQTLPSTAHLTKRSDLCAGFWGALHTQCSVHGVGGDQLA